MSDREHISLIGAGLAGPVMAKYLSDHGYIIDIYERRPDMRVVKQSAGRSINLALSARGITVSGAQGTYVAESILENKEYPEFVETANF